MFDVDIESDVRRLAIVGVFDHCVPLPTGGQLKQADGTTLTLFEVPMELDRRMTAIFLRDDAGRRPVFGGAELFQHDPEWSDHLLFYEYFHGDNGAGIGASHQTGWTGLVAKLLLQQAQKQVARKAA